MPTIFSGVENRIAQARERHQELHRKNSADWRTQAARPTSTVNTLNEANEALDTKANEALDTKANAALALSMLACTISIITATRRR